MAQPSRVQISVDIFSSAAPPNNPWTAAHLLQHFHVDAYRCDINDLIFPMMSGPGSYLLPAIESFEQYWVGWDELLAADQRVHWAISENCFVTWQATLAHWARLTLNPLLSTCAWSCILFPLWR